MSWTKKLSTGEAINIIVESLKPATTLAKVVVRVMHGRGDAAELFHGSLKWEERKLIDYRQKKLGHDRMMEYTFNPNRISDEELEKGFEELGIEAHINTLRGKPGGSAYQVWLTHTEFGKLEAAVDERQQRERS